VAIALTEALAAADRTDMDFERGRRAPTVGLHVIPVDQRCPDDAARLARERPLRLAGAIHLAATLRAASAGAVRDLDAAHVRAAVGLGCEVVAP